MARATIRKPFESRLSAGKELGQALEGHFSSGHTVVCGLSRGGLLVASGIAAALKAPLEIVSVRNVGHPLYPGYSVGALSSSGEAVYNLPEVQQLDETWLQEEVERIHSDLWHDKWLFKSAQPSYPSAAQKDVIIADEGMVTGLRMELAIQLLEQQHPSSITLAIPIAPLEVVARLSQFVDKIVLLENPSAFRGALPLHYQEYHDIDDQEVAKLLRDKQLA